MSKKKCDHWRSEEGKCRNLARVGVPVELDYEGVPVWERWCEKHASRYANEVCCSFFILLWAIKHTGWLEDDDD